MQPLNPVVTLEPSAPAGRGCGNGRGGVGTVLDGSLEGPGIEIAAILGGLLLGATFAALDAALTALGEVRLKAHTDAGGPYASTAARALRDLHAIQARLLVGRVLCLTSAAALTAVLALSYDGLTAAIGGAAAVAFLYGILAEVATTMARRRAGRWALRMLKWLHPVELLMVPLAAPLAWLGRVVGRAVPAAPSEDPERVAELGLERMIEEHEEEGSISVDHAELLRNALEFKNTVAHEVMVPRTQMVAIEIDTPLPEVLDRIIEEGHSRYPVYREKVDNVQGVLYAKDLFAVLRNGDGDGMHLRDVLRRPVFYAAETQKIGMLLKEMQSRRVHLAVVVDEFGGTSGIVTLEDILEEIVGEIRDEYDEDETGVQEISPGRYIADAGMSVYDLEDYLGVKLHDEAGDYDSLGGMVVELAGHVPATGESVVSGPFRLIVRDADQRHVRRVEILRRPGADAAE